jgi:hypothetical protein
MTYTITFRVPATVAEKVVPVFSHVAESPVVDGDRKASRPAREAGKLLSITSESENVAKVMAEILAKDFDDVEVTQS